MIAFALMNVCFLRALAQDVHSHPTSTQNELTQEQQSKQGVLLKAVREATERFKDVRVAETMGIALNSVA
jgi:hypothetical protein